MNSNFFPLRARKKNPERLTYHPEIEFDANEKISFPPNFIKDKLYLKKGNGFSRKTYLSVSKESNNNRTLSFSISEKYLIFEMEPIPTLESSDSDDQFIPRREVDAVGRFVFNTDEGFADIVPAEMVEPIRQHHHNEHSSSSIQQGSESNATSQCSKADNAKSYNPMIYSSLFSRPATANVRSVPMLVICHNNGMYRPIVKEFLEESYPKIRLFSCVNYWKNVFCNIPSEMPKPPLTPDFLKFTPPQITMCEFCRINVKDANEHRASPNHRKRAIDAKWDSIDKIICDTKMNLEIWPFQAVQRHSGATK